MGDIKTIRVKSKSTKRTKEYKRGGGGGGGITEVQTSMFDIWKLFFDIVLINGIMNEKERNLNTYRT